MRRSMWLVAMGATCAMLVSSGVAFAQNSQQTKMTSCNADAKAKGLAGDDRKAFMKTCLSDKSSSNMPADASASQPAAATPGGTTLGNSQQEKMKSCNAEAKTKGLKGDDRKAYMKTCLSAAPH